MEGYASDANDQFADDADDYHHYFKIVCKCGDDRFRLIESNKQSVKAVCGKCGHEILLYDLSKYPAASKMPGDESFSEIKETKAGSGLPVFVMYEYGELDDDQEFDPNDITWFQVFVEASNGRLVKVFDDETA
jgi:hypothetical protein